MPQEGYLVHNEHDCLNCNQNDELNYVLKDVLEAPVSDKNRKVLKDALESLKVGLKLPTSQCVTHGMMKQNKAFVHK